MNINDHLKLETLKAGGPGSGRRPEGGRHQYIPVRKMVNGNEDKTDNVIHKGLRSLGYRYAGTVGNDLKTPYGYVGGTNNYKGKGGAEAFVHSTGKGEGQVHTVVQMPAEHAQQMRDHLKNNGL